MIDKDLEAMQKAVDEMNKMDLNQPAFNALPTLKWIVENSSYCRCCGRPLEVQNG